MKRIILYFRPLVDNKFIKDILRDKNCDKYSMLKFLAFLFSIGLILYLSYAIKVMIVTNIIDHSLIIEVSGLILSLLGLKTFSVPNAPENPNIDKDGK